MTLTVLSCVCVCVSSPQTLPSFKSVDRLCPIISGLCGSEGQKHCSLDETQGRKEAEREMFSQRSDLITHRVIVSKPSHHSPHSVLEWGPKGRRGLVQRLLPAKPKRHGGSGVGGMSLTKMVLMGDVGISGHGELRWTDTPPRWPRGSPQ